MGGQDPGRPEPDLPLRAFTSHYDLSIPADAIVDRWDYELGRTKCLGDAFPHVCPNFGPGALAAFLGCRVRNTPGTTWFEPPEIQEIDELDFAYDPDNVWLRRVRDVTQTAVERWGPNVQVAMTDLGGTLDVLSSFRPGERLLLDMYDHPEHVERLTWQLHELWWRCFDEIDAILRNGGTPGYTAWTPLISARPSYMLQCDLSYMIGPEAFARFVLPELSASCRRLPAAAYHLDGPGQLTHVDALLGMDALKAIQYVPMVQAKDATQYPELYRRLRDGGKRIQVFGYYAPQGLELLDVLAEQLGDVRGVAMIGWVDGNEKEAARRLLHRYGVDEE